MKVDRIPEPEITNPFESIDVPTSVVFVTKTKTRTRIIGRRFQRTRTRIIVIQKTKTK